MRIVISHVADDDRALVIPVSTVHDGMTRYDHSCLLWQGEHSFLTEPLSYAYYGRAEALSQKDLDELSRQDRLISYEDVSAELLHRLQSGARNSPHLQNVFRKYFEAF